MAWYGRPFVRSGDPGSAERGKVLFTDYAWGGGGGGPMTASRDVGGWDRVRSSATTAVVVIS